MTTINFSILALLAVVGFVQPTIAQTNPTPLTSNIATTYRKVSIAPGYKVAYLYTTHSTNSPILKTFRGGERVEEIETRGAMMKVKYGNQKGWIRLR